MDEEQRRHLENLRRTHQQQLHVMEVQAARFGQYAPPYLLIGIEDTRKEIAAIDAQLAALKPSQPDPAQQSTGDSPVSSHSRLMAELEALLHANQSAQAPDKLSGLERILGVNNLKQISWIERGLQVSRCVCRILSPQGFGTGFLISAGLLMTNNHVIPNPGAASASKAEFNYQHDFAGKQAPTYRYQLDSSRFHTNPVLDYTIVGVLTGSANPDLATWGHVLLNPHADPVPGEHVIIIQHPNGGLKQIVLTANQVVAIGEHYLQYTTDTLPGSSGSPVFNDLWQVIAIHHAGSELPVNAQGGNSFVNEGILMSTIQSDAGSFWPSD